MWVSPPQPHCRTRRRGDETQVQLLLPEPPRRTCYLTGRSWSQMELQFDHFYWQTCFHIIKAAHEPLINLTGTMWKTENMLRVSQKFLVRVPLPAMCLLFARQPSVMQQSTKQDTKPTHDPWRLCELKCKYIVFTHRVWRRKAAAIEGATSFAFRSHLEKNNRENVKYLMNIKYLEISWVWLWEWLSMSEKGCEQRT